MHIMCQKHVDIDNKEIYSQISFCFTYFLMVQSFVLQQVYQVSARRPGNVCYGGMYAAALGTLPKVPLIS